MNYKKFRDVWQKLRSRCDNPHSPDYKRYGGRGITYDPSWKDFNNFKNDMLASYEDGLTIDRIDNNKGYSKENCQWVTRREQANNRRTNVFYEYMGIRDTLGNWARFFGLRRGTLWARIYRHKWDFGKAIHTPVMEAS